MKTSKSTLEVARIAFEAAKQALPQYSHPKSPHKFTQAQLISFLIIKQLRALDFRGIHVMLTEWFEIRKILGLQRVPHFTTLCAASKRLLCKPSAETLLHSILQKCRDIKLLKARSKIAAIDSTGIETSHASRYYTRRCKRHERHYKKRFPKLSAICDTSNHLILGMVIDRGPKFYKRNGYYYILAPAGGVKNGWQLALRSRDVYGPYECKFSNKVTVQSMGRIRVDGSKLHPVSRGFFTFRTWMLMVVLFTCSLSRGNKVGH